MDQQGCGEYIRMFKLQQRRWEVVDDQLVDVKKMEKRRWPLAEQWVIRCPYHYNETHELDL